MRIGTGLFLTSARITPLLLVTPDALPGTGAASFYTTHSQATTTDIASMCANLRRDDIKRTSNG